MVETVPAHMRVPQFRGAGQIVFGDKAVPVPGPDELLLEIKANALCGSERGQFLDGAAVTPGHEAAGVVVAAGPGCSTGYGTPGVVFLMAFCGACRACRSGATNQCLAKQGDFGFNRDGGYAPFAVVPERCFFAVDAGLSPAEATMLLDVMGTSAHAIRRAQRLHDEITSVLITGAGPVGLGLVAMVRLLLGPRVSILVADLVAYRLALAARLGGIAVDLGAQSVEGAVSEHIGSDGVDVAIDASGKRVARQSALSALGRRGVLVCVGHGERLEVAVSSELIAPERGVLGSEYFRYDELAGNLELLRQHRAYLAQIITHRLPAAELSAAFELFWSGDSGKVVVEH